MNVISSSTNINYIQKCFDLLNIFVSLWHDLSFYIDVRVIIGKKIRTIHENNGFACKAKRGLLFTIGFSGIFYNCKLLLSR